MTISFRETTGHVLQATDGEIGRCKDFLFDDETWTVRYMVADTRKWLPGRKVLISPLAISTTSWEDRTLPVQLSRDQIKNSPELDEDAPISRRQERRWADYFGYRRYWADPIAWGPIGTGMGPALPVDPSLYRSEPAPELEIDDRVHIRSCDEMLGYVVQATNGELGHVADVLIDPKRWSLHAWRIAALTLSQQRDVPIHATESIDWHARTATLSLSRQDIAGGTSDLTT